MGKKNQSLIAIKKTGPKRKPHFFSCIEVTLVSFTPCFLSNVIARHPRLFCCRSSLLFSFLPLGRWLHVGGGVGGCNRARSGVDRCSLALNASVGCGWVSL